MSGATDLASQKLLFALCKQWTGTFFSTRVMSLSIDGCSVERKGLNLREGSTTLVKIESLAAVPARVTGASEGRIELEFDQPLYAPVVEHLQARLA